jgi:3-hydroxyacyl-CoA dehydrogenase
MNHQLVPNNPTASYSVDLDQLKRGGKVFKENASATVIDVGDRIGLIEFHTKANAINAEVAAMITAACTEAGERFDALVVGNRGRHFSAGANLTWLLSCARNGNWSEVSQTIEALQNANMLLKYGPLPTVAAPFSYALGGGCEICLHCRRVIAADALHMGLVETSVGLVPSGGGTKELTVRAFDRAEESDVDFLVEARKVFRWITTACVSKTGQEAKELFLKETDEVVPGHESPIEKAKAAAGQLDDNGHQTARKDIPVLGKAAMSDFEGEIDQLLQAKSISEHDALIARHVANIITAGDHGFGTAHEQHFLDLERQAFLSLLGTQKTQERIEFMLKNNKPLRN